MVLSEVTDGSDRGDDLDGLLTEAAAADLGGLDLLSTAEQVALANALDAQVPVAVAAASRQVVSVVDATVERLGRGGVLRYLGAGTAGLLAALDAAELAPTFGIADDLVVAAVAAGTEDDEQAGRADVAALRSTAADVLVAVSASGRTPYVVAGALQARRAGALTVALVCSADSRLTAVCDLAIEVLVGPELVAGSTRLRAGTAQKLVLNQISTLTMVRLGHTYGNLMVGVRGDNAKLVRRRARVVEQATGAVPAEVDRALAAAGGDAKTATVMLLAGVDADQARERLVAASGHIRAAAVPPGPLSP